MNVHSVSIEVGGRPLTIETGKYANKQMVQWLFVKTILWFWLPLVTKDDVPFDFLRAVVSNGTAASGSPGGFARVVPMSVRR